MINYVLHPRNTEDILPPAAIWFGLSNNLLCDNNSTLPDSKQFVTLNFVLLHFHNPMHPFIIKVAQSKILLYLK